MPTAPMAAAAPESAAAPPAGPGTPVSDPNGITNNQEQGVDEGDIVKARGDLLVILRRGRLFTVRMAPEGPVAVSSTDAFAPGAEPASWYDEMLIDGDQVVVTGYGYNSGGTELNRFTLSPQGALSYRDTLFVRSQDYYSARNYASRVVGGTFVAYMPVPLERYEGGGMVPNLPAVRHRRGDRWDPVVNYAHLYRPLQDVTGGALVHTVLFCDLRSPELRCRAEGIVGPSGRSFYVSRGAVYVWVTAPGRADVQGDAREPEFGDRAGSMVYRFPLDGGEPGAVGVRGGPTDQFSFQEANGRLNVLVRAEAEGDGMWSSELSAGDVGLVGIPLDRFDGRARALEATAYARLPRPQGQDWQLQNRFVGNRVLYGSGSTWWRAGERVQRTLYVHDLGSGGTTSMDLPHGIDRLEPLGRDAVVVGTDGRDLHFTSVSLQGAPSVVDRYVRPNAAQGETRSHGFFYRADGERVGVLGLPMQRGQAEGWEPLGRVSAEVGYLRVEGLRFSPLGSLAARPGGTNDHCRASCADWYGNARPIFWRDRVFALLGYELVEGRLAGTGLFERARVDVFAATR